MHSNRPWKTLISFSLCVTLTLSAPAFSGAAQKIDAERSTTYSTSGNTDTNGAIAPEVPGTSSEYTVTDETDSTEKTASDTALEHIMDSEAVQDTEDSTDSELTQNTEDSTDSEAVQDTEGSTDSEAVQDTEGSTDTEAAQNTEVTEDTETPAAMSPDTDTESVEDTEFLADTESLENVFSPEPDSDSVRFSSDSFYGQITDKTYDSEGYYIRKISASSIAKSNANTVIQKILNEAASNASDQTKYKIVIEPGQYTLTKALRIYSNTYLYMDGVTFLQQKGISSNMLRIGDSSDTSSGYYYRNITLYGGIWDENGNSNTAIKAAHAANVVMLNQTLQNTVDSHLMEVAGIQGLTISGCTFKDQLLHTGAAQLTYEAIQLDVLVSGHFGSYLSEDLPMQNVSIDRCTFTNVPRGIGTHTAILNNYMSNIQITNNTFTNIGSAAIQGMGWKDCVISGNIIANAVRGIYLYSIRNEGIFLSSTPASKDGIPSSTPTGYVAPPANLNITVSNNQISCGGTDPYDPTYESAGIFASGISYNSNFTPVDGDIIPAGDYYLSGITVSNNTITATRHGIVLNNVKNSTISVNPDIRFTGTAGATCYGIVLRNHCDNNLISQNTINISASADTTYYGIAVQNQSNTNTLEQNTVNNIPASNVFTCHGIIVQSQSKDVSINRNNLNKIPGTAISFNNDSTSALSICENVINAAGYCGINTERASISIINNNRIENSSAMSFAAIRIHDNSAVTSIAQNNIINSKGIEISKSTVAAINKNQFSSVAGSGITLADANVDSVTQNTISSASGSGISIDGGSISSVSKNTISSPSGYGIAQKGGSVTSITSNSITKPGNHGIVIYNNASCSKVSKNTVTSGKAMGINIGSLNATLKLTSNTIKKCKTTQIYVNQSSTDKTVTIEKNDLTGTTMVSGIRVDSGKVSVSGNKIRSCKNAILLRDTVKATIKPNTYSKNKSNTVRVENPNDKSSYKTYKNLSMPTSVKAKAISKSGIQLTWKKVSKVDGYLIYRAASKNGTYKKIATVTTKSGKTSYTDKKLKKNKKYYYKIIAYKKSNNKNTVILSADSKIVSKNT